MKKIYRQGITVTNSTEVRHCEKHGKASHKLDHKHGWMCLTCYREAYDKARGVPVAARNRRAIEDHQAVIAERELEQEYWGADVE